ncbi:MAG: thiol protease/hemagglutinin PrtT [Bacteroidales bacterium]|nr:thiol protease/hemagglutinin PrtT [Bacteroidales bacterium]
MKRLSLLAILLTALLPVQAKPVDPSQLLRAAQHVLQRSDVVDATPASFTDCRLFVGADGQGFVLLSDDDCVRPLLGYSLTNPFPTEAMPSHVAAWIEGYQREIASAKEAGSIPSQRARDEWDELLGLRVGRKSVTAVAFLLKTRWDQVAGYNNQCPYDSVAGARCYTGCVATATAQVMKYWNHPEVGRGSHSYTHPKYGTLSARFDTTHYQWSLMPNTVSIATTQQRIAAMSQLISHVGIAVDMGYGTGSSGAHTNPLGNVRRASSETALKEYFRYNPALFTAYKEGFSDAEWRALIDADLDSARPVLYDGYGPAGGHAFVLDGRDTMGRYHFNWGWGGSANGYYTLDSLSPTATYSFSQLNSAIFRVYPITVNDATATLTAVSSDTARGTVSGSGTYPVDSLRVLLLATAKPGYRFDHWRSGNPANPIITSPTNDFSDTAVFVPIHRDSVGYCRNNGIAYKNLTEQDSVEWGIRIPFDYLEGKQRLREVHFWTYEVSGPYHLRLYRGTVPDGEPFYTDSLMASGYGMNIYHIPAILDIDFADTTPLWVTIYAKGSPFPISYSHFTGTVDGSWVRYDSVWQPMYEALQVYGSWMLRAVLDPSTHVGVADVDAAETPVVVSLAGRTVTVQAAAPVALYDVQGRLVQTASAGRLRCTLPAAGIYIVRSGSTTKKIVVF